MERKQRKTRKPRRPRRPRKPSPNQSPRERRIQRILRTRAAVPRQNRAMINDLRARRILVLGTRAARVETRTAGTTGDRHLDLGETPGTKPTTNKNNTKTEPG